jgi:flagellum-specific ATP synthase
MIANSLIERLPTIVPYRITGSISQIVGLTVAVAGFPAPLGAVCTIQAEGGRRIAGEVIGFQDEHTLLLAHSNLQGVRRGNQVTIRQSSPTIAAGDRMLGRVLDGRGCFIDNRPVPPLPQRVGLTPAPLPPLQRPRICEPLGTGIRVIDSLMTCGKGQRLGIFAGSGVGKSVLLGQMARNGAADVNVIVLVGERGREVREFIEKNLGPAGMARSVVVVATNDEPALLRLRAAYLGTAIAEHFRDSGRDVLLMMDSITRFAAAQREIGLAAGEPPTTRGYPPSVFALLPRLLERSGRTERGSITGLYSVLVEGDDPNEPVADAVRGILDGHILLSRKLAHQAHWPAVDVLASLSRSMSDLVTSEHRQQADRLKRLLAAYQECQDLISIGAYQPGSNPLVDEAIRLRTAIQEFLCQGMDESVSYSRALAQLTQLMSNVSRK